MPELARVSIRDAREFVERFEEPELPVVLEGAIREWPAVRRWSAEYLKRKLGHVDVHYKLSATHQHPNFHAPTLKEMFARGRSTFAEFVELVTKGDEPSRTLFTGDEQFLIRRRDGETTVNPDLAPLLEDLETPALVPIDRLYTVWSWFSGRGVRTWLHYDNNGCHNLNAQLTGRKHCALYPPSELARLHPFPLGGPNPAHNCSQIDVEAVDERFANFRELDPWEGEIVAGDLLFIPAWWFHTFLHVGGFNSNVNFWWKPLLARPNSVAERQAEIERAQPA